MKNLQQWISEYDVSHQNKLNKIIHYFCVPAIFFSIIGLIYSIPSSFLIELTGIDNPLLINWAVTIFIPILVFYLRLSLKIAIGMLLIFISFLLISYKINQLTDLWVVSLLIFVIAWIGQFYGHKVEGKKPSFLKDIQFLLIGPAWILNDILSKKK